MTESIEPAVQYVRIIEKNQKYVKRVITIAYRFYIDSPTKNIEFAASIFRNEKAVECDKWNYPIKNEFFCKKSHIQTALGRLAIRPLYAHFPMNERFQENFQHTKDPSTRFNSENNSEDVKNWINVRKEFDEAMKEFLRREVCKQGVKASTRLRSPIIPNPYIKQKKVFTLDFDISINSK